VQGHENCSREGYLCSHLSVCCAYSLNQSCPWDSCYLSRVRLFLYISKSNRTGSVRINVALGCVRVTIIAVEKQKVLHILNMFIALGIKNAVLMRRIILSSVACLDMPCFSASFHKRYVFSEKEVVEHNMCFDFRCNFRLEYLRSKKN
jgi:hypothetical protein